MAKVKIQGNASGTGVLTVTAPNTSTDRTITLPDATGTLLNSDGDGSSLTGISAGADTSLSNLTATGENKVCQAWVNFNGTGTIAIRDSHNVSSLTDNGTGNWSVNYTTVMANANYSVITSCGGDVTNTDGMFTHINGSNGINASYVNIYATKHTGTVKDVQAATVIVFGD